MITFQKGELEIALATYNRPQFVERWIELNLQSLIERNASVVVYDASDNTDTYNIIKRYGNNLGYYKVNSSTLPGQMSIFPWLNTDAKYVWVIGESRYHSINELDETVFACIKDNVDYIVINAESELVNDIELYHGVDDTIKNCFVSGTCTGLSICKTELFNNIRNNKEINLKVKDMYWDNFAWAFMGYLYSAIISSNNIVSARCSVGIYDVMKKKTQTWAKRFYGCWVEDLSVIVDRLDMSDETRDYLLRHIWTEMDLDGWDRCCSSRINGDLNKKKYMYLKESGILSRFTSNTNRIKFFSSAPLILVKFLFVGYKAVRKIESYTRWFKNIW